MNKNYFEEILSLQVKETLIALNALLDTIKMMQLLEVNESKTQKNIYSSEWEDYLSSEGIREIEGDET